jgi:threonine synthase
LKHDLWSSVLEGLDVVIVIPRGHISANSKAKVCELDEAYAFLQGAKVKQWVHAAMAFLTGTLLANMVPQDGWIFEREHKVVAFEILHR